MTDVFVSYKQEERASVVLIANSLRALKVDVWFDEKLRAGGSFDEDIARELNAAPAVLVCWTPAAIESEWVRGEAALAHKTNKLVCCFLAPTELIPPFNLLQSEDLSTWGGQTDAPGWIRLLEAIGAKLGRPGIASFAHAMRADASLLELRGWAAANGADPLANDVWARISMLEGETSSQRIEREKEEARRVDLKRKADAERSREFARQRKVRLAGSSRVSPFVVAALVLLLAVVGGAGAYYFDAQQREAKLNAIAAPADLRAFITANGWHPIKASAEKRLADADETLWKAAGEGGSVAAYDAYLKEFNASPDAKGAHADEAVAARETALEIQKAQTGLKRIGRFDGPADGARNALTEEAVIKFRFDNGMRAGGGVDDDLQARIDAAIAKWINPSPDELRGTPGPPSDQIIRTVAARLDIDAPALAAVRAVEASTKPGFGEDGRPLILFEPHIFSRRTNHAYDESHPTISRASFAAAGYARTQDGRWAQLAAAWALSPQDAYAATSFGVYGILGQNFEQLGFQTPGELARFLSQSEDNQTEVFARFIEHSELQQELQQYDWAGFARKYNGPGYTANQYDRRLALAYEQAATRMGFAVPEAARYREAPAGPASAPGTADAADPEIDLPPGGEPPADPWTWIMVAALALAGLGLAIRSRRRA